MSDLTNHPVSPRPDDDPPFTQRVVHQPVSARVPERVARGVFSTGQVVLDSPKEFCIDFLFGLTRPHQVVARVVVAPATMVEFARALEQNLALYQKNFGIVPSPPSLVIPRPPPARPSIEEIYQNFKLPEDVMGGVYANSVMISHSPTEFCFDFIAGFYPTSVVTARVFIAAPSVPRFLNTLKGSVNAWKTRVRSAASAAAPEGRSPAAGTPDAPPDPAVPPAAVPPPSDAPLDLPSAPTSPNAPASPSPFSALGPDAEPTSPPMPPTGELPPSTPSANPPPDPPDTPR